MTLIMAVCNLLLLSLFLYVRPYSRGFEIQTCFLREVRKCQPIVGMYNLICFDYGVLECEITFFIPKIFILALKEKLE